MRLRIAVCLACVFPAAPIYAQISSLSRRDAVQTALERGPRLGSRAGRHRGRKRRGGRGARVSESHAERQPQQVDAAVSLHRSISRSSCRRCAASGFARRKWGCRRPRFATISRERLSHWTPTPPTRARSRRATILCSRGAPRSTRTACCTWSSAGATPATRARWRSCSRASWRASRRTSPRRTRSPTRPRCSICSSVLGMTNEHRVSDRLAGRAAGGARAGRDAERSGSRPVGGIRDARRALPASRRSSRRQASHFGFEYGDPDRLRARRYFRRSVSGSPLPLFDRNRGAHRAGRGGTRAGDRRARARARRSEKRDQSRDARACRRARARRARIASSSTSANSVATMALTAYREGASSLPNVLEAQRTAREVLASVHR